MRTPLGVLAKVRPAEQGLDLAPLALAGLALALVWTLVAHFALTAGTAVAFDERVVAFARRPQAPRNAEPDLARTAAAVTLVSARGTGIYVVAGRVIDRGGLREELRVVAAAGGRDRPVLIKADGALTMQAFVELCALVREAGFPGVLIATEEPRGER
ncbi:MAG: ExbD/TolR family protein [Opitutia bacterium]